MIDLFEDYENIPNDIQDILDKYSEDFEDGNYEGLFMALKEVRDRGYTFEYYVNGDAYGLRPIGVPLNELEGYEDVFSEFDSKIEKRVAKEYVNTELMERLKKEWKDKNKYAGGGAVDWYDFDKKMALINLNEIHEYAVKLDNIVTEETELEEWVKMKLTRIEQNVADVKKSLEGWEKFEEFGEGGRIFKKQLLHIAKYAKDLIAMIKLGSKLMSWQENKLAVSAEYIDAIYHHLDYKMGNRASDIKFANGGGVYSIPNNYEGKSPKDIWYSWSKEQRKHFLYDHQSDARDSDEVGGSKGYYYSDDIDKWVEMEWNELPSWMKNLVFEHTDNGQYAIGGAIKTDFNELENTELRNVLISFWNDFFNNHIGNYLSIEKENYVLSNIDNVFVIVRDKDKGNFSDVEKQKIDNFLSPYFDSNKKPLFADFFNSYEIKDNKITIYVKDMYANGGGVGFERVTNMDDAVVSFLTKSNNFNYTNITVNHSGDNSFLLQYGTLIAKKVGKEVFITDKKYSKTTSKLQNLIKYTAEQKGFKVFQTEFFNAGGDLDLKIGKYEINPETFEVKNENGDVVHKAQTLSRAKIWAKSESKHDKDVVYENNNLEITRDAIGNLHFDFDRIRNTGWAFDTYDVGTAVAIISHSSMNNDEKLRNIEINSRQLRDSDREMIVYWLSGGNKEWRFGETYNKSFDETYKEIFDDVALKIKKLMQKEKTIGGLIDLFERYDVDYFINYAQQEGSWGEYVYDEDYEREKEMDEELAEYEDGEDYAKEYILDNYKYKNTEEILNDLINYFEQEDIEYDEDRINDIIKETFESIDKQTLSLFKNGGGIGFIPMDVEDKFSLLAKWGGMNIREVIEYFNAMIDANITDADLQITPTKNTLFQRERSVEQKIKEIWGKVEPKYKGELKGNRYYSMFKELISRNSIYEGLLTRFKAFRKNQKFAEGGGVGGIEISKIELENMVGKKLNGWNDDIVYYNGKKYQKCYLRPYYKEC